MLLPVPRNGFQNHPQSLVREASPHSTDPPDTMAKGLLGSRQAYVQSSHPSPDVDLPASSGLLWTPMATAIATLPVHWTHAWALSGEWANHITPLLQSSFDGKIYLATTWVCWPPGSVIRNQITALRHVGFPCVWRGCSRSSGFSSGLLSRQAVPKSNSACRLHPYTCDTCLWGQQNACREHVTRSQRAFSAISGTNARCRE